ncbi:probable E3 ubiquitin-protein ligase DTX2 isoform X2 [Ambystoma mexicanum]|uniref:probable E3 ubiquitin-protein ligase DTX2 isoform X2 n=1 Tax=Ambystoma mexicanum TaxID=8296 RepID=UPI0037E77422
MAAGSSSSGAGTAGTSYFMPRQSIPIVVAVWEWQDEFGNWRPYSGGVCNYIEQCLQFQQQPKGVTGNASTCISLGQADAHLAPYSIDIPSMTQFRQGTGTMRNVRRQIYPQHSAPGKGIQWEWQGDDGSWTAYEMNLCILLEDSYASGHQAVDLASLGLHYTIDFASSVQVNKITRFQRRIQRRFDTPYPVTSATGSVHKPLACTCHQCLGSNGVGPIPSRSRHSTMNPSASSAAHSSGRTMTVGPPSFVPYHKPGTKAAYKQHTNITWAKPTSGQIGTQLVTPAPGPSAANGTSAQTLPVQMHRPSKIKQALAEPANEPESVVKKYMDSLSSPPDDDCIICMEKLGSPSGYGDALESKTIQPHAVGKLKQCGHDFHVLCMLAMYNNGNKDGSLQCPACKTIYGEKTGTQPKGKMDIYSIPQSLPGHPDCGTIQIIYSIPPGIQGPEHPNPGRPYTARGFPRHCYIPENSRGKKVLELLKVAWNRRLIFTVGVSSTTGEGDTVVWNEIHHKTEMCSNISGHGYPDPKYLDNVLSELAAQGVTEDCLQK